MKTAIIKTSFWDDEGFEELHLDSKIVYFYLLTNPNRTLHHITKINPKIMQAHTGLDKSHIDKGMHQLQEVGLIKYHERYYVLLKSYVEPKKGRFTASALEKESSSIPLEIKDFFSDLYLYSSGTIPEHIDIDNNIDKNKGKNNIKIKAPEQDNSWRHVVLYFYERVRPSVPPTQRFRAGVKEAAKHILSLYSEEEVRKVIDRLSLAPDVVKFTPSFLKFTEQYDTHVARVSKPTKIPNFSQTSSELEIASSEDMAKILEGWNVGIDYDSVQF